MNWQRNETKAGRKGKCHKNPVSCLHESSHTCIAILTFMVQNRCLISALTCWSNIISNVMLRRAWVALVQFVNDHHLQDISTENSLQCPLQLLQTIQCKCAKQLSVEKNRIKFFTDVDNLLIKFRLSKIVDNLKFSPRTIHISSFGAVLISDIINEDGVN